MNTPQRPEGLSTAQAQQRLRADGHNELPASRRRSLLHMGLDVLREPMFLLLMGAGSIYWALGDTHEALVQVPRRPRRGCR